MSYLLSIGIGPVQEFIAAARRTADLQAGSELLVSLAKATAQELAVQGATLIFPADPLEDGPNKILALVESGDPKTIACEARKRAEATLWNEWVCAVDQLPRRQSEALHRELAKGQIERFLEFYCAWRPLGGEYRKTWEQVERLLAGRKALRDFRNPDEPARVPKSPLDPSRSCVMRCTSNYQVPPVLAERPLWLKKRETLDAISLLKRVKGVTSNRSVPSTSEMAVRPLLAALRSVAPEVYTELEALKSAAGGLDWGDLFFPSRVQEAAEEGVQIDAQRVGSLRRQALGALGLSEAPPYLAILVADGDRMGRHISELPGLKEHQEFSAALSRFAREARDVVTQRRGHLVYSGGDDVLALLPVTEALVCAEALARSFSAIVQGATLSVGIAIVHHLEALQVSIGQARAAEQLAKRRRSSLGVALHTRGGSPTEFAIEWGADPLASLFSPWISGFAEDRLSRGLPYELRDLARLWMGAGEMEGRTGERLRAEVLRIMGRKKGSGRHGPSEDPASAGPDAGMPELPDWVKDPKTLADFANFLVIARFLARPEYQGGRQ